VASGMTPVEVECAGEEAEPRAVLRESGWVEVTEVVERSVVEVGWWRTAPARPRRLRCWRVLLASGECLDLRREPGVGWTVRVWG
jgi:hypothetical protein